MRCEVRSDHAAVFLWNGIGDCWLSIPTLRALKAVFAKPPTLIMPSLLHDVLPEDLFCLPWVEIPSSWDRESPKKIVDLESITSRLRAISVFISLTPWDSDFTRQLVAVLQEQSKKRLCIIAVGKETRVSKDAHYADNIFEVAKLFYPDVNLESFVSPSLQMRDEYRKKAAKLRSILPSGKRVLAVHNHSSEPNKELSLNVLSRFMRMFLVANRDFVIAILDPVDRTPQLECKGLAVFPLVGFRLGSIAAFVPKCNAIVAIDSCMLHMADMSATPALGLFGPTSPIEWGFRFSNGVTISRQSMSQIDHQEVFESVHQNLV